MFLGQRANVSVGKDPALHHFPWYFKNKTTLLSYFGGYWYNTPSLGKCDAGRRPGEGEGGLGCTWRIREAPTYIKASCLIDKLVAKLYAANSSCFDKCGGGGGGSSSSNGGGGGGDSNASSSDGSLSDDERGGSADALGLHSAPPSSAGGPYGLQPPSSCVGSCITATVLAGIPKSAMVNEWENAFKPGSEGCPHVHVEGKLPP